MIENVLDYEGLQHYDEKAKKYNDEKFSKKLDKTSVATSSTLGLVKSGTDITVDSSGNVSVNDDSHNHIISNVDGLQSALDAKVPTTRTINNKALSANITLSASDVGADASGSANTALSNAKAYTDTKINEIVGEGASETLDTIGEISKAIEEHQDITDALNAAIGNKVDKEDGKGLSTNDYTDEDKEKLTALAGATVAGVKGDNETDFRTGNVTITAENVGAVPKNDLLDMIYPVGAIYMSTNNVSPSSFLGGTWEQIKDKFLLSAGDNYAGGATGGEATYTPSGTITGTALTTDMLPSHNHTVSISGTTATENALHKHTGTVIGTTGNESTTHKHTGTVIGTTDNAGEHTHNVYAVKTGESGSTQQRVCSSSSSKSTFTSSSAGYHSHTMKFEMTTGTEDTHHTHSMNFEMTTATENAAHAHDFSISGNTGTSGNGNKHSHTFTGIAGDNMPPYLTVYMWQRTA